MRKLLILLAIATSMAQLTACTVIDSMGGMVVGGIDKLPFVYRIEIRQGNIVTQKMVDQLRPGMDQRQIIFLLGTPLLVDPFNSNRWDYFYTLKNEDTGTEQKLITLIFEDGQLVSFSGNYKPNTNPEHLSINTEVVNVPAREVEKKGILERMLHFIGIEYEEKY